MCCLEEVWRRTAVVQTCRKVMRRVLLCMLEAVEFSKFAGGAGRDALYAGSCGGELCLREVSEVLGVLLVLDVL